MINHLLSALPPAIATELAPAMATVVLSQGDRLHEPGEAIVALYFPLSCVLAMTLTMSDGASAATGIVGRREMIGLNAVMGNKTTTQTAYVVQVAGSAMQIEARVLLAAFDRYPAVRAVLLRYTQALIAQMAQNTACNSHHSLEQRLARWLLEVHDRVAGDEVIITQAFLATMLGSQRSAVTQAAHGFQERGLLRYRRGHIHILQPAGLESSACECFQALKTEDDRLLGTLPGALP
ncbi:cAMP-binding proteins - catabolite gene activator and regulatory subunit of cAMP-dependent protein kinases [uncultured Leptolyngbya sp.]|uniref:cAMP-binding proteins - catabolite gene activator and regulatory subunit of cAMP-dependent protein kinases n=1 Tax=uncultured Leptolyngbya sp. TaxID=332963 RepID=A0A6J4KMV2_9CYAN|nr:cAMP-binding proteins - catabolite gene activator and regulatory subunit of cAMP-dependent protein kinases [uncultured Leptolyngbya sp.]